jgi:uncharacterized SAM-binding protein YcdF (DUF218 family)
MAVSMSERGGVASLYPIDTAQGISAGARRLQIASELLFLLGGFYAGLSARSFWIIIALGLISTLAYAAQHWRLWREASRTGSRMLVWRGVLGTLVVQTVLIAILYLAGLGLWTLINSPGAVIAFGWREVFAIGILSVIAIFSGFAIGWLERRKAKATADAQNAETENAGQKS